MPPNPRARREHEALFPGHVSTLAASDPELIEIFDNLAFDEVLRESRLDRRTRLMAQLAALIACQALAEWRILLHAALGAGVAPVEAREIVYQAVPYVGMAKVFDFLHAANEAFAARGIALPLPAQAATDAGTREAKGRAVQAAIIGEAAVERRYANAPADALHIERLLSANCFGDHLARGGIALDVRELLTFSMLVALGGCDAQVKAHVAANLRLGNDRRRLIDVLTQLLPFIGYPRTLNGLAAVNEAAPV